MASPSVQSSPSSTMMIPRRGAPTMTSSSSKRKRQCCSSSLVKAKRHCSHKYCGCDWGAEILEDMNKNHMPSPPLKALPPLVRPPPPIIWCGNGDVFWLLEIVGKTAGGKLYLPDDDETKKLFRGSTTACIGFSSSHGCILFEDKTTKKNHQLSLLHPLLLSIFAVRIPPIKSILGVLVLPDPITSSSYALVALNSKQRLMFAKCGGGVKSKFSELEGQNDRLPTQHTEMICINNCIYTITGSALDHYLEAWDCSQNISCRGSSDDGDDGPRKVYDFKPTFATNHYPYRRSTLHLVESQGELWLVAITRPVFGDSILKCSPDWPVCFVYRMDFKGKNWVRVDSLGDHVLIITEFQTICLSAKEFPQYQRNSIYFTHYHIRSERCRNYFQHRDPVPTYHLVVFNMEDCSLKELKTTVEE